MHESPLTWPLSTWLFGVFWAILGGITSFMKKLHEGHSRIFNVIEMIGEFTCSSIVGVGVFMASQSYDHPIGLSAAFSGIGGHMGTRLLFLLEQWWENKLKK